jgi:hypothetical protein
VDQLELGDRVVEALAVAEKQRRVLASVERE